MSLRTRLAAHAHPPPTLLPAGSTDPAHSNSSEMESTLSGSMVGLPLAFSWADNVKCWGGGGTFESHVYRTPYVNLVKATQCACGGRQCD